MQCLPDQRGVVTSVGGLNKQMKLLFNLGKVACKHSDDNTAHRRDREGVRGQGEEKEEQQGERDKGRTLGRKSNKEDNLKG